MADDQKSGIAMLEDGEEAGFWAAVEHEDVQAMADTLSLKDDAGMSALATVFPALSAWRRERRELSTVDTWRYRLDWQPVSLAAPTASRDSGTWLFVTSERRTGVWTEACTRALEDSGVPVSHVEVGPRSSRTDLAALLRADSGAEPPAGVLSLLALEDDASDAATDGLTDTLTLLQALVDAGVQAPLWCATQGAVSCGDTDPVTAPSQASVWGLGRVAALEHPELWGGLVDLPIDLEGLEAQPLYAVLCGDSGEDQVALRPAGAFGCRLVPDAGTSAALTEGWQPRDAVLVTGGVGSQTDRVIRWLAERGAEHVVLLETADEAETDRRRRAELVAELKRQGTETTVVRSSVADQEGRVVSAHGKLTDVRIRTVVQTSLPGELASLVETTPDQLRAAVSDSVDLGELIGGGTVETVLFFSSVAATLGSREHGTHAAANARLDALAQRYRPEGPRMVSVGWGIWDLPDDGEPARQYTGLSRRQGLPPLEPRLGLTALHAVLERGEGHVLVADIEWERFAPLFALARPTRLLDGVPEARKVLAASGSEDNAHGVALRGQLAALPPRERMAVLLDLVGKQVSAVLRHEPGRVVESEKAFKDLGFDSLVAVELRNRLRAVTGVRLPSTLVYDYPTPSAVAEHLLRSVLPEDGVAELPAAAHLNELEGALAGLAADDPRRRGLVRRLQALLWKHTDTSGLSAPAAVAGANGDREGDEEGLATASADEMFALIDQEWGSR